MCNNSDTQCFARFHTRVTAANSWKPWGFSQGLGAWVEDKSKTDLRLVMDNWMIVHYCCWGICWGFSKHSLLLLLSYFSRFRLCATPWTAAHQAPPPVGFSRQESWSGLPLPSPLQIESTLKWSFTKGSSNDYRFLKSDFVQLKVKYFVLISETVHF